ncbi:MAG: protein rep [Acidimicrobiales bacterium]
MDQSQALIRDTCGDLAEAKRIVACGRRPIGSGNPTISRLDGRAYASGLQTCGSVWVCPACSFKIRAKRAAEISTAVAEHVRAGGGVLHVVVTMPHRAEELLRDTWKVISDCWAHVTSGGGWKTFKERHGVVGFIRSAEVTHSFASGWHPHCHILLFVDQPMSPVENDTAFYQVRAAIRHRWCHRMATKHGRTMSEEFGIRVDPVKPDDADGSGQYLTKAGYEMAMLDTKLGRTDGHRTPFAVARDASETGDMADIHLVREWVRASHGKRSITWSHGLRHHFGLGTDRTDEDLASEEAGGETITQIDRELWRQIVARRDGARARFIGCFDHESTDDGLKRAVEFLSSLGLAAVVDRSSPTPLLGLQPTQQETQQC